MADFIFGCSKITADGDCSHEIKRRLLLGRTVITNLNSVLKSRDITLLTKVHIVKAIVFPVVMYGCESWTMKKAEHQRIDAFEPWCWRIVWSPCCPRHSQKSSPIPQFKSINFWCSKITADGDCSHEIKRRLLLGRKVMTNLDSIFKSRDITLPTKVCLVKAMVFPVVMYGC